MPIQERSYSGQLFRPTPEIYIQEDGSFGVIATPWGNRQGARKSIELLTDYILSARQDIEATSPFQKLTCLSPLANNLRAGVMLVNDSLYREDNKSEYVTGVELLVFARHHQEMAFAQVGYPQLLLARQGLPWIPLSVQMDLAVEFSMPDGPLAPLPPNLLGLHSTTNMNISSFNTQPGDRLIFLSHSVATIPLSNYSFEQTDLDSISSTLANQYPHLPFWLGLFDLAA
jgi:hypothetical protein